MKLPLGPVIGFLVWFASAQLAAVDVRDVKGTGVSESAALEDATKTALNLALRRLNLEASPDDRAQILYEPGNYFRRERVRYETRPDGSHVTADFIFSDSALRAAISSTSVTNLSSALDEPQIAFALVPRSPQGTVLEDSDKQSLTRALNTALAQELSKQRIRVVSPGWLIEQQSMLSGNPKNIERFERNVRQLAKMDPDVDYIVVGTATIDVTRDGVDFAVSVRIDCELLDTDSESNLVLPMHYSGALKSNLERVAMTNAGSLVAERIAHGEAIPRIVSDWRDHLAKGKPQIIHLFHDTEAFRDYITTALEDKGVTNGEITLARNLVRMRYRSPAIKRVDFNRPSQLRRLFENWTSKTPERYRPEAKPFFSVTSSSDIVIAPDTPEFREMAASIVENRKYEVMELKEPPQPLVQNRPSPTPVNPDPDTALAMVAKNYVESVGVAYWTGADSRNGIGTAWAMGPDIFATNAHVAKPIRDALAAGRTAFLLLNRSKGPPLRITKAIYDTRYDSTGGRYDVGILKVDRKVAKFFPLATDDMLKTLDAGEKIAYLGFPAPGADNNLNLRSPIASMQSGIIVAISDYDLGDGGFSTNVYLRHSAPTFGGASGSPLFTARGVVIGVHSAGLKGNDIKAMINFGQRVDILRQLHERHASELQ
jgi:V8-like Glu-specific endopeptidase